MGREAFVMIRTNGIFDMKYCDLKLLPDHRKEQLHDAIDSVLQSGWYLRGEATKRFERHYARYIGTRYCVGCGNGLDALWLILRAYKEMGVINEGDEVIVPANTYIASLLAITENRLVPVLVEPNLETLQIDESQIEKAITRRTRAVMIVHLYGSCAYSKRIAEICKKYELKLVEDNAQAHGCEWNGIKTGALGDAAGHSFYPTKNLGALGDAGAVTTNDEQLAEIVRELGNYGSSQKYLFERCGRNSRIDEIQAAVLDVKLSWLDSDNQSRRNIANIYDKLINNPLIRTAKMSSRAVYHIYPLFCEKRNELQTYLKEHDVETVIHYPIPPHLQKCYHALKRSFPITELIHQQELSLPCYPMMKEKEADHIARLLNDFC